MKFQSRAQKTTTNVDTLWFDLFPYILVSIFFFPYLINPILYFLFYYLFIYLLFVYCFFFGNIIWNRCSWKIDILWKATLACFLENLTPTSTCIIRSTFACQQRIHILRKALETFIDGSLELSAGRKKKKMRGAVFRRVGGAFLLVLSLEGKFIAF